MTGAVNAEQVRQQAHADHDSVVALAQQLVRIPSRGGLDPYEPIIDLVAAWLAQHGITAHQLTDPETGRVVGITCDVPAPQPGPRYVLDACIDTAPFGDPAAWRYPPTSGMIANGWLHGRGAADSKTAVAIFLHIAARLRAQADQLRGTLSVLFDADEHTGGFGGARRYFAGPDAPDDVAGVMIGYPGTDQLVIGGRGFLRARATIHARAGHTGSEREPATSNAVDKAAQLATMLAKHRVPGPTDPEIGLPPRLTVTGIHGGESYSIIPDRCTLDIDIRLTPSYPEVAGRALLEACVRALDQRLPTTSPTTLTYVDSWPAYRLREDSALRTALTAAAARHLPQPVPARVAGPSNIGNYLAKLGIDATAGLGVAYHGLQHRRTHQPFHNPPGPSHLPRRGTPATGRRWPTPVAAVARRHGPASTGERDHAQRSPPQRPSARYARSIGWSRCWPAPTRPIATVPTTSPPCGRRREPRTHPGQCGHNADCVSGDG